MTGTPNKKRAGVDKFISKMEIIGESEESKKNITELLSKDTDCFGNYAAGAAPCQNCTVLIKYKNQEMVLSDFCKMVTQELDSKEEQKTEAPKTADKKAETQVSEEKKEVNPVKNEEVKTADKTETPVVEEKKEEVKKETPEAPAATTTKTEEKKEAATAPEKPKKVKLTGLKQFCEPKLLAGQDPVDIAKQYLAENNLEASANILARIQDNMYYIGKNNDLKIPPLSVFKKALL